MLSNLSINMAYNLNDIAIKELFKPIIKEFLSFQIDTMVDFRILNSEYYFSSFDFKNHQKLPMEYIYLNILEGIRGRERPLNLPISVFITFDKKQCSNYCSNSNRYFSSIKVGGISKIYYILFTIDELFDYLYSKEINSFNENKDVNSSILVSNKVVTKNKYEYVIKGYLDNHNIDKRLSFVSTSDDDGYPIFHKDYPDIIDVEVGSILELHIINTGKSEKVVDYNLSGDKEINGLIQFFDGTLKRRKNRVYITTDIDDVGVIFVPYRIAENFEEYTHINVCCLARKKNPIEPHQYEWSALQVIRKDQYN